MYDDHHRLTGYTGATGQSSGNGYDRSSAHPVQDVVHQLGCELDHLLYEIVEEVRRYGQTMVREEKGKIAARIQSYAQAAHAAADRLAEADEDRSADYPRKVADTLDSAGQYLEQSDARSLYRDLRSAARRHPTAAAIGIFLGGLGLARILSSSGRPESCETSEQVGR